MSEKTAFVRLGILFKFEDDGDSDLYDQALEQLPLLGSDYSIEDSEVVEVKNAEGHVVTRDGHQP